VLFTFPSRYLFTIGHQRVFSLARWFSQFPTDFHLFRGTWECSPESHSRFRLQDYHLLWFHFPEDSANEMVSHSPTSPQIGLRTSHNPRDTTVVALIVSHGLGCSRFARHYSGNRCCFFFLGVLRYFTSPRWLTPAYGFSGKFPDITREGLPHSEIAGSQAVSAYPTLIAGSHVLHRLLVPRHPPYALSNLTKNLY
jgi:hypothetical protein